MDRRAALAGISAGPIEHAAEQPLAPIITEPGPAPEISVDGYCSVGLSFGVAKFAFFSMLRTPDNRRVEQRINLRLSMPIGVLVAVHQAFGKLIDELKAQGQIVDGRPE